MGICIWRQVPEETGASEPLKLEPPNLDAENWALWKVASALRQWAISPAPNFLTLSFEVGLNI